MRNMDTGFERENVLYVPLKDNIRRQLDAFTRDLEACPEIRAVSYTHLDVYKRQGSYCREYNSKIIRTTPCDTVSFSRYFLQNVSGLFFMLTVAENCPPSARSGVG